MKYVVSMSRWPRTIKILISNWHENSSSYLKIQARKIFSYHAYALVTLHVQFLCSDWSKFDRWVNCGKIYAASWNLFINTLAAEADRVLRQLVMFLTVFFHWMYKMNCSCYQESSVIHGRFVYRVFGWEIRRLSKSEIRFRMASFSTLLDA